MSKLMIFCISNIINGFHFCSLLKVMKWTWLICKKLRNSHYLSKKQHQTDLLTIKQNTLTKLFCTFIFLCSILCLLKTFYNKLLTFDKWNILHIHCIQCNFNEKLHFRSISNINPNKCYKKVKFNLLYYVIYHLKVF